MKRKIIFSSIILSIAILLIYLRNDFKKTPATLYFNGNIITIDQEKTTADAMLVVDGVIEAIGVLEQIEYGTIKNLNKKDLKGATVLPGFIDVHTHFTLSMFLSEMFDLSGFKHRNNKEVWQYFEETIKKNTGNDWLLFKGLDPVLVDDLEIPTIEYLDRIAPDNPIVIFSQSLHSYWANSEAFKRVGITNNTKNPTEHSFYEKDSAGKLTGLIVEQDSFKPFIALIKQEVLTAKLLSKASSKVMHNYAKNGNTTIVSAGLTINDSKPLILLQHLSAENPTILGGFLEKIGQLPSREPAPRHLIYMRHDMAHLLPKNRSKQNDFYDIIGIKHWYDGSPYIGSMYMEEAYLVTDLTTNKIGIPKNSKGKALVGKEALKTFIKEHHEKGWQIAIHTQGDATINEVVNAYEELDSELDFSKSRHRLEHCLMLPTSKLGELKKLNLTPSFHINHLYYYGESLASSILGEERTSKILPLKSAIKSGLKVSLHADQPMFESNPFRLIQTAVERKTNKGKTIGEDEKIDVLEAIKALTINAAWLINMEHKIGSLEKGKYADFVILSQNPFKTAIDKIHEIECTETYINGNSIKK